MPRGKKSGGQRKMNKGTSAKVVVVTPKRKKPQNKQKKRMPGLILQRNELGAVNRGRNISVKQFTRNIDRQSGTDYLYNVTVPTNLVKSTVINSWLINPQNLIEGSRLAQFADLWDKYQFEELIVHYIPSVGSQTAGRILLAADVNVSDDYTNLSGDPLVQKFTSVAHQQEIQVAHEGKLVIKDRKFFDSLKFIEKNRSNDPLNVYAGRMWLTSVGGLSTAVSYGTLMLQWKIKFTNPNIDDQFEDGTSYVLAPDGTMISSFYPWGNWNLAIASWQAGTGGIYLADDFVTFRSDTVLGSVIQFNAPGAYLITMYRTGVAMGTGAFSTAVFSTGCTNTLPTNDSLLVSRNSMLSNAASTASMWNQTVWVTAAGATVSNNADAGVTHTTSFTSVSKIEIPIPASSLVGSSVFTESQLTAMFERMFQERLERGTLISSSSRSTPGPLSHTVTTTGVMTSTASAAGEPSQSFTIEDVSTTTAGTASDPVFIDPVPSRKEKKDKRQKKFTFIEALPSDEEEA